MDEQQVNRRAWLLFATTLAAIFAGGGLWLLLSSAGYTTYRVDTSEPVSGLIADAPVEFHGVEVGRVRSVELAGPRSVAILLEVKSGTPVSAATVATVTSRGLAMRGFTGYVYVSLEDSGAGKGPLPMAPGAPHAVIPTAPAQVASLDLAMNEVKDNVQALTQLVQALLDQETVAALKDSAASLERVSRTLGQNAATLQSLLVHGERASRDASPFMHASRETLARIDALLEPRTVATVQRLATSLERVSAMLADNNARLDALIARGEEASRELQPLMQSTHETVKLLQGQVLPEAHRTLSHLDELSTTLTGAARKMERDPSVLIRGVRSPTPGPGESK